MLGFILLRWLPRSLPVIELTIAKHNDDAAVSHIATTAISSILMIGLSTRQSLGHFSPGRAVFSRDIFCGRKSGRNASVCRHDHEKPSSGDGYFENVPLQGVSNAQGSPHSARTMGLECGGFLRLKRVRRQMESEKLLCFLD